MISPAAATVLAVTAGAVLVACGDRKEQGLQAALRTYRTGTRIYERKLDGAQEAHLIALACSAPPEGRARWTLRLLARRMVELAYVDTLSYETVRQTLKKERAQTASEADVVHSREALGGTSSSTWRMCWRSITDPMIRSARSCA